MCIFCKIVSHEISAKIVYENDEILAFKDIHPVAPVHILIIPRKHIESVNDLTEKEEGLIGKMVLIAKKIAQDLQIAEKGYKLLIRTGKWGGQEISHLHMHLIGGAELYEEIKAIGNDVNL